jgi:hypothetical protein
MFANILRSNHSPVLLTLLLKYTKLLLLLADRREHLLFIRTHDVTSLLSPHRGISVFHQENDLYGHNIQNALQILKSLRLPGVIYLKTRNIYAREFVEPSFLK